MPSPVLASLLLASLVPSLPSQADPVPPCPAPSNGEVAAAALFAEAEALAARGDIEGARALLRRGVSAGGNGSAGREAMLRLIALGGEDEQTIAPLMGCLSPQGRILARGEMLLQRGEPEAAIAAFAGEVLPRHHTLPRWSIMHERLGDAFAAMGRMADAQAQWRLALATDSDPGGTRWNPAAVEAKLAQAQGEGLAPLLPLIRYHDAVAILLSDSVTPTDDGVAYSKLILLQQDNGQTAYGIDRYEVRCDARDRRVLSVQGFGADGSLVSETGTTSWIPDRPGEPFLPTERRLICDFPTDMPVAAATRDHAELLKAYRAGGYLFD